MTRIKSLMTADDWQRAEDEAGVIDPRDADALEEERAEMIELRAKQIYENLYWNETDTASWAAALDLDLWVRVEGCREQAKRELGL
jgi:hypothetical protein